MGDEPDFSSKPLNTSRWPPKQSRAFFPAPPLPKGSLRDIPKVLVSPICNLSIESNLDRMSPRVGSGHSTTVMNSSSPTGEHGAAVVAQRHAVRPAGDSAEEEETLLGALGDAKDNAAQLVAMALPNEAGFTQDVRELAGAVKTQVSRAEAVTNLEHFSHATILRTLTLLYVAILAALLVTIVLVSLEVVSDPEQETGSFHTVLAVYGIEGLLRTAAVAVQLWLLFSFPQRCFVHAFYLRKSLLPEQTLLMLLIFSINLVPSFSIFGPIAYWTAYSKALNEAWNVSVNQDTPGLSTEDVDSKRALYFLYEFTHYTTLTVDAQNVNWLFVIFQLATGFLAIGTFSHILGLQPKVEKIGSTPAQNKDKSCARSACCNQFLTMFQELLALCNRQLTILITMYVIFAATVSYVYEFTMSSVPLVEMITVLKVCTQTLDCNKTAIPCDINGIPPAFASMDASACNPSLNEGVPFARAMCSSAMFVFEVFILTFLHYISASTEKRLQAMSYESARSKHLGFRYFRSNKCMMWSAILIVGILTTAVPTSFLWIFYSNRPGNFDTSNQYDWAFDPLFQVGLTFRSVGFGMYQILLVAWIMNLCFAYLPPGSDSFCGWWTGPLLPETNEMDDLDNPIYVVKESDVIVLREFRKEEARKRMRLLNTVRRNPAHDYAKRFRNLIGPHHTVQQSGSPPPPQPQIDEEESSGADDPEAPPVVEEIKSNYFILELQVLMWNFAHIAYELGSPPRIVSPSSGSGKKNTILEAVSISNDKGASAIDVNATVTSPEGEVHLTDEQKQAKIGDPRYRLIEHIENFETEIQCAVFFKRDETYSGSIGNYDSRIVITFRGTYTSKNVATDLDYGMVLHHFAEEVLPPQNERDPIAYAVANNNVPLVHRGFYLAYLSVREKLMKCIDKLLDEHPDSVVFCTGHSLGGALAVYCAFDIGASSLRAQGLCKKMEELLGDPGLAKARRTYRLMTNFTAQNSSLLSKIISSEGRIVKAIHCTTFGSPRVGNYSFTERCRTAIHKLYRFVVQSDAVPKLPPAAPLGDMFKWGYHHAGTQILMDLNGNILIKPSFVERQIMHGWRGYSSVSHYRTSYAWALMLWCARVHADNYVPDWWISLLDSLYEFESSRIESLSKELLIRLQPQIAKEGVVFYKAGVAYQSSGFNPDSPFDFDTSSQSSFASLVQVAPQNSINEITLDSTEKNHQPVKDSSPLKGDDEVNSQGSMSSNEDELIVINTESAMTDFDEIKASRTKTGLPPLPPVAPTRGNASATASSDDAKSRSLSNSSSEAHGSPHRRRSSLPENFIEQGVRSMAEEVDRTTSRRGHIRSSSAHSPERGVLRKSGSFTMNKKERTSSNSSGSINSSGSTERNVKFDLPPLTEKPAPKIRMPSPSPVNSARKSNEQN